MPRPRKCQDAPADQIDGEAALSVAVIRQALKDLRSPVGDIQHEAVTFWQNAESVRFWEDVIGAPGVLQREAHRLMASWSDR